MLRRAAVASVRQARCLSTTSVVRKDLVQDLYLRELKAYKPAPVQANAHVGSVKEYSQPAAPKAPELPSNLAAELAAYDATNPDVVVADAATSEQATTGNATAFLAFLEADLPKEHEHGH
ncbi:ATP synthase complex subunit H-domain-containing protein [Auriculariales sp. MPI-PUGE-AT-0066]|nr:ATP synthase complex subunit H-domain-containing protein [Auriculariales sp. MPI-PUGE-AT-0066]